MKKIILFMFLFIEILNADKILQSKLDKLTIFTEEYSPISFKDKNGKLDGLAVEVAREIMRRLHMKQKIKIQPWARSYKMAQKIPNFMLFSASRVKEREKLFQWVGPIFDMKTGFYVRKNSKITINSLDDAKKLKKIGSVRKSYDTQFLKNKGFKNLELTGYVYLNIKKLMRSRFDVICASNVTIKQMVKKAGYSMKDIKNIYNFLDVGSYFIFSKKTPIEVVNAWQQELDKMKKDGTLNKIIKKWLN